MQSFNEHKNLHFVHERGIHMRSKINEESGYGLDYGYANHLVLTLFTCFIS